MNAHERLTSRRPRRLMDAGNGKMSRPFEQDGSHAYIVLLFAAEKVLHRESNRGCGRKPLKSNQFPEPLSGSIWRVIPSNSADDEIADLIKQKRKDQS